MSSPRWIKPVCKVAAEQAFPTGRKWSFVVSAPGKPKYVICNADESEPGTFKDRLILEGDPFSIIEALTIAGYAVGAR